MAQDWFYFSLVLIGMVAATVFTRSAFLLLPARLQLPPAVLAGLLYAPIAAIAAIIAPELIAWRWTVVGAAPSSAVQASALASAPFWLHPKLLAAAVASAVHWRFANMLLTIAVGMVAFWLLRSLTG